MTDLDNAVVLLTGAAGGFGQEFTRQLLAAGSRAILTDLDEDLLRQKAEMIQEKVTTGEILACFGNDLAQKEGCEALYRQVKALGRPIDILINNAGLGLFGRQDEVPPAAWERLIEVNLLAPMRLSALFATDMIARQKGHIVNISSLAGWCAIAGMTHYATSKFGLRGFSEGLLHELKPHHVRVTVVYPFFSRTPILQCPRYGILAEEVQELPAHLITDPARVIERTIQGIQRDRPQVFPDAAAQGISILKRYCPTLVNWMTLTRR